METPMTQEKQVLKHLQLYNYITSWDAIRLYGITRLSAVIFNLRQTGYDIKTHSIAVLNKSKKKTFFAKYELISNLRKIK